MMMSNHQDTSRKVFGLRDNSDLFKVCEDIGIPQSQIYFTNCDDKVNYIKRYDFLFHLDDDNYENNLINSQTKTKGIWCFGKNNWKKQINKICEKI